ncbi:phosphonate ABC transporter, permease protein PhnE [Curtobacterium sp. Csp1]|uniref:phosphonate ABC transporter, permease protein PhnE n=1 Tax=unclassified Curtobacterium TaxID=257496 RepID=UPI001599569D|nr:MULTISPECIES: phosphonate ABC transporter, permease protein PhnE [unclassified Curtobacterium]QKS12832.1 phosphonate ABC transporter, permease protein PhnE [Curtobacterium sp. csp3]QKS19001.1 phosphonate ABC transporter, permease protein PhnE [Curtobacterium sp. Csp1]
MTTADATRSGGRTPRLQADGTGRPRRPRTLGRTLAVVAVVAAITVWSAIAVQIDVAALVTNARNASATLVQLVQPDYSFIPETLPALLQTVQMAVVATAVSTAVAIPLSFAASRATNPNGPVLAAVRLVMNVVRSVPDLLFASLFVTVVGTGALSGVLALVLFNVGILVKLVSEALDGVDRGGQEAALAAGATWFRADRAAVLPEVAPSAVSQVVYVLELNIRASTVIGLVGAGGLGMLIDKVRTFYQYHYLSTVILEVLALVVLLELLSSVTRKRLLR